MNEEQLTLKVKEVAGKMVAIGIPVSHDIGEVVINSRTKMRLGACLRKKNLLGKPVFTIEISQRVLDCSEKDLCSIIAHELLHTCEGCFNHGKEWKKMGKRLEEAYDWNIRRAVQYEDLGMMPPDDAEKIRYTIICKNCGHTYNRKRMCKLVKTPTNYRCGKCGGTLKLEEKSTTSCR